MINAGLLEILCCPETHQEVKPADAELVKKLNARITSTGLKNRAGQLVKEPLDEGLMRADGRFLYPIRNNLPVMLIDEAIPLTS